MPMLLRIRTLGRLLVLVLASDLIHDQDLGLVYQGMKLPVWDRTGVQPAEADLRWATCLLIGQSQHSVRRVRLL